jgi:hypothetical protein
MSKLADAIRYALSRWEGLSRFLGDGRIEIDTNTVECSIRAAGSQSQKCLFAGADGGGDNWVIIATLVESEEGTANLRLAVKIFAPRNWRVITHASVLR